jgi:membrane protease YdiL (CAAX protease family)
MRMTRQQYIAIGAPLFLAAMMIPVFQLLAAQLGNTAGWYVGLLVYWIIWGALLPAWLIGYKRIRQMIQPQRLSLNIALILLIPLVMSLFSRFIAGSGYEKPNIWIFLMLLATAFGNGFFEEVLWRGVYTTLFRGRLFFSVIWPSLWFALWHYAPGSVHAGGNVLRLMLGAGFFGLYLSVLARETKTIWWSIVAHTCCGLIMVV